MALVLSPFLVRSLPSFTTFHRRRIHTASLIFPGPSHQADGLMKMLPSRAGWISCPGDDLLVFRFVCVLVFFYVLIYFVPLSNLLEASFCLLWDSQLDCFRIEVPASAFFWTASWFFHLPFCVLILNP